MATRAHHSLVMQICMVVCSVKQRKTQRFATTFDGSTLVPITHKMLMGPHHAATPSSMHTSSMMYIAGQITSMRLCTTGCGQRAQQRHMLVDVAALLHELAALAALVCHACYCRPMRHCFWCHGHTHDCLWPASRAAVEQVLPQYTSSGPCPSK
jgi:hypothetical protein